jgi:hypothetical protein
MRILKTLSFLLTLTIGNIALAQTPEVWYPVYKNGKQGFINKTGEMVVDPSLEQQAYYDLENTIEPVVVAKLSDGLFYAYTRAGKFLMEQGFKRIYIDTTHKLMRCTIMQEEKNKYASFGDDKIEWYNYKGEKLFNKQFTCGFFNCGYPFINGLWKFNQNEKCGLMNQKGEIVVQPKYNDVLVTGKKFHVVNIKNDKGQNLATILDTKGKELFKPIYKDISKISSQGLAFANTGTHWAVINTSGKVVTSLKQLRLCYVYGNLLLNEKNVAVVQDTITKKFGLVNERGQIIIQPTYDGVSNFYDKDIFIFNKGGEKRSGTSWNERYGGTWVMVNAAGKELFKPIAATEVTGLSEGLAIININDKYGYCNTKGKIVIEPQFKDRPQSFSFGLARLYGPAGNSFSTKPIGYVNAEGKIVWPIQE